MKYATLRKIYQYNVFSDTYFPVYVLGFCPYAGKFGSRKTFTIAYLIQCPTQSIGKLRCNIFLLQFQNSAHETPNLLHCYLPVHFFFQPQVTVYISGGITIHLLGINTGSIEFQPNSTGFKLVCGADIRSEVIKMAQCDLRISPCDILDVPGKDDNILFFSV